MYEALEDNTLIDGITHTAFEGWAYGRQVRPVRGVDEGVERAARLAARQ